MVIVRTPYRVSFFGGGTDYKPWYEQHGGAVLTSTINRYSYISACFTPKFYPEKYRIQWSRHEAVDRIEDIQHPGVRGVLQHVGIDQGFYVSHAGDLPARSGLGSSSAFTVGLLHAVRELQGFLTTNAGLAGEAVHVEQTVLKETVGIQDQIECAIGGLNVIRIEREGDWHVERVALPPGVLDALQARLMLFWTGLQRSASEIAADQVAAMPHNTENLQSIQGMVSYAVYILSTGQLDAFGELLHEGWILKQRLSPRICTQEIFELYEAARHAGALGGKVLGAGGGGFLLVYARPKDQEKVRAALPGLLEIPFRFEDCGTQLVLGRHCVCDKPKKRLN